jgi:hypothetical protein
MVNQLFLLKNGKELVNIKCLLVRLIQVNQGLLNLNDYSLTMVVRQKEEVQNFNEDTGPDSLLPLRKELKHLNERIFDNPFSHMIQNLFCLDQDFIKEITRHGDKRGEIDVSSLNSVQHLSLLFG